MYNEIKNVCVKLTSLLHSYNFPGDNKSIRNYFLKLYIFAYMSKAFLNGKLPNFVANLQVRINYTKLLSNWKAPSKFANL